MALLPDRKLLDGTKVPETTTGEFLLAMGNFRQFIADLLGTDSGDRQAARDVFGVQEKYRAEAAGTADALTAAFDPLVPETLHGMHVQVRAKAANTTATPTFRADETGTLPIVKGNDFPLLPGDIAGNGHWLELKYDAVLNKWVLENPAFGISLMPVLDEKADKKDLMSKLDRSEATPSGLIAMWSGAADDIPAGWLLCNGQNGTPDLRNRFIVAAGGSYTVHARGGAASAALPVSTGETTLTVAQMPSHTHGLANIYHPRGTIAWSPMNNESNDDLFGGYGSAGTSYRTYGTQISSFSTGSNASHSHNLAGSVPTLPPYYALCFIMKQ